MAVLGLLIGLAIGYVGGTRTTNRWNPGVLAGGAGAIFYGVGKLLGISSGISGSVFDAAVVGFIWCLIWGLVGGAIGRRRAQPSQSEERTIPPPSSIRCFSCKADIAVLPELLGKKTKCPKCGTKNQLPG